MPTAVSSSSTSMGTLATPLTSPSFTTSPTCATNATAAKEAADPILTFQSDPSLPALLSSTSSVSADPEGDFLGNPGDVSQNGSVIDTTDSLTPPALGKEPIAGFPLEAHEQSMNEHVLTGVVPHDLHRDGAHQASATVPATAAVSSSRTSRLAEAEDEDEDDSDSDEGLTMGKGNRKSRAKDRSTFGRWEGGARRRDTNGSVGSTDTAKKLFVDRD